MIDERFVAARGDPSNDVALRPTRTAEAAPEDDERKTKTGGDRRQSGGMSERIGTIQDGRRLNPDPPKRASPREQIAHERFTARNQLVCKYKPWAGLEPPVAKELIQFRRAIGTNGQVVVEDDRLAVEQETLMALRRIVDQLIDECDEALSKAFDGMVPLAIPVGVGDDVGGEQEMGDGRWEMGVKRASRSES